MKYLKIIAVILFAFQLMIYSKEDTNKKKPNAETKNYLAKQTDEGGKKGSVYRLHVNNIDLPILYNGVIADAEVERNGGLSSGGEFDGITFLFSSGFYLAGKHGDTVWANAMASASRDEHYLPGTYETVSDDPRVQLYVLKKSDGDFHKSWTDWKEAVELGAEFYDGNGNGIYDPIDLNENGKWDENEDRPDLLGDETVWCVYHDGMDPSLRSFDEVTPKGIEIRQTVFGFDSFGAIGNVLYVRYEVVNTGLVADEFDSVYFGVWSDPDIGDYVNDLVGCDTLLNAGYDYDNEIDREYENSPCFIMDLLQGPHAFIPGETYTDVNNDGEFDPSIDTPLDTAFVFGGEHKQSEKIPGARNLEMTSFIEYLKSHPTQGDPVDEFEAYNYLRGYDKRGQLIDPCYWLFGEFRGGLDCNDANPVFMCSGDPVADYGWICTVNTDQRMIVNTGPFKLVKNQPQTIWAAYVVGRGETSLLSVNKAKEIDNIAQYVFDQNFVDKSVPPQVEPEIISRDSTIKLIWETSVHVNYHYIEQTQSGSLINDLRFEGFEVYMHRTPINDELINGQLNKIKIASYDLKNEIGNIVEEDFLTGQRNLVFEKGIQLNPEIYGNPQTGRIELVITDDPFTGGKLIKGKTYYFSIRSYALNYLAIEELYPDKPELDFYVLQPDAFDGYAVSDASIINGDEGIVLGDDQNIAFREGVEVNHSAGPSDAAVKYTIVDHSIAKNHEYEISFMKDSASVYYNYYWRVTDKTNGNIVLDSIKKYNQTAPLYLADGVMLNIDWVQPRLLDEQFEDGLEKLFAQERPGTGTIYVGEDIDTTMFAQYINNTKRSIVTTFDHTRRVELRFDQPSKAYRYFKREGSIRYLYPDPAKPEQGSGFVDVPFSAWVKDDRYGEEYQLATAYLEREPFPFDSIDFNDNKWNPGHNMASSGEYIVIFNSPYDPTGTNVVYTGTGSGPAAVKYANLPLGYAINRNDPNFSITDSMAAVANSPWFDAMYLVALEVADSIAMEDFNPTGIYVINRNYPLCELDKYTYNSVLELTNAEKKNLFDKVNVVPNPFFGYNDFAGTDPENQHVTFTNLPEEVTIKIYSLAGALVRTLNTGDKSNEKSPFLKWDLENENGFRVGSGMYLALITSPGLGEKVLKFAVIQGRKYSLK